MKHLEEIKKIENLVVLGSSRTITEAAERLHKRTGELQFFDVKFWVDKTYAQKALITQNVRDLRSLKAAGSKKNKSDDQSEITMLRSEIAMNWKLYKFIFKHYRLAYDAYMDQLKAYQYSPRFISAQS